MKRDAYGDDGPAHKRYRHPDNEATFLIPSKVAGSIIGKAGSNISKLRSEYKASITVPDCPGPERVLSISADVDTVTEILKQILPCLADAGLKGNNEDFDVRLLIHQSRAGCVIGKGGAKIKELREKTGARLKIFSNLAPQSTERVVQLVGKLDAVVEGVREVLHLINQVPIKGSIQNYDPHNYDDFYADEYGGFGSGAAGGSRPGGRAPPPLGPAARPPRAGPPLGRAGPPPPRAFNDYPGPGPGPGPRGFGPPPRAGFGGGAPYAGNFGGGRGGGFGNNGGGQPETTTQVTIPKDLAGAIIGKAGSRIRKIRGDSGAGIEIAEPLPGSDDRIITITGTPQRIQMAQYLLQQSVHENNPNIGRGNF
ncbi:heterogeneous nuclear ribonucleoprotein K [Epargyreus clarus]|uniref:heterogeneous nuclear ribonucleoprotein K n=1 Tax=Epargyreus clarus TaxID=520877 RepID=UPI003C2F3E9D